MAADPVAIGVRIEGKVQGVWFRAWTMEQARRRGLDGWVRNRRDGTVEALFQGAEAEVRAMIAACYRGPDAARVSAVRETAAPTEAVTGFSQRPTE